MKEILLELYNIEVITFIKVSNNVYRIKTSEKDYALKYINEINLETIIEKLKILKIDDFVFPLKNIYNTYISTFEGVKFIVSPWIEEEKSLMKDLRLKFFLDVLANLHNKSFYTVKVNESFFDETYDYIADKIDKTEEYLENYMKSIERKDYKSPSEWLFLLNYPVYVDAISKADKALENFKEKSQSKTSVRLAFTYNDFDYKHIILKEEKILGIESIEVAPPVYDVFYTFSSLSEINIDLKIYYERYFQKFILDEYEKDWLLALLYIPRIENLSFNEVKNLEEVISSLNYIKNSEDIANIIRSKDFLDEN